MNQFLSNFTWPGNIRELQHLVERSVVMAKGNFIENISIPAIFCGSVHIETEPDQTKSIFDNRRDYILSVLKKSKGKIWGAVGAAELLRIPPTTLAYKMKKTLYQKDFND